MYHNLLKDPSFHILLKVIDDDLAELSRKEGCCHCGGPLHQADYPRSPLGLPASCREHYESRRSLCCGKCRKRTTTPSVRFFGRRRFPAVIILLISAFMAGSSRRRYHQVKRYFGINLSFQTWVRWHRWWKSCLIETAFWKQAKAHLPQITPADPFPRQFILIYAGLLKQRLEKVLKFLAPLTAGVYRAV